MKTIVAVTDLSERSAAALQRAATIAAGAGADLMIVHAVDDSLPKYILGHRMAEAEEALRREAEAITGAKVRWEVATGDIFWALHRAATKAHARRSAARGILGSVSSELIRHGTTDLLIVPRIVASAP